MRVTAEMLRAAGWWQGCDGFWYYRPDPNSNWGVACAYNEAAAIYKQQREKK